MRTLALTILLAPFATAEDSPAPPAPKKETKAPTDPRKIRPDHAPTPFTADDIRLASPEGRKTTFRIERVGQPNVLQTFYFKTSDVVGTMIRMLARPEGKPMPASGPGNHVTWRALQSHASFPEKATTITEEKVETPLGTFDCLVYTVERKTVSSRFCFAKALPGPPVVLTQTSAEGKSLMKMTIVDHRDGTEPGMLAAFGITPTKDAAGANDAAKKAIGKNDKNDDGALSQKECPWAKLSRGEALRGFARIDRNADGRIDAAELARATRDWAPAPPGKANPAK